MNRARPGTSEDRGPGMFTAPAFQMLRVSLGTLWRLFELNSDLVGKNDRHSDIELLCGKHFTEYAHAAPSGKIPKK